MCRDVPALTWARMASVWVQSGPVQPRKPNTEPLNPLTPSRGRARVPPDSAAASLTGGGGFLRPPPCPATHVEAPPGDRQAGYPCRSRRSQARDPRRRRSQAREPRRHHRRRPFGIQARHPGRCAEAIHPEESLLQAPRRRRPRDRRHAGLPPAAQAGRGLEEDQLAVLPPPSSRPRPR